MGDFLKGWRRKVGCITLFLMLQATGWWILNQGRVATLRISGSTSLFEVASIDGKLWFVAARSTRPSWISYWPSIEGSLAKSSILDGNGNIRYYSFGNQFGPDIIAGAATWTPWNHAQFYGVSFLSVILLLTPLSAYLLFDKQRRKNSLHMIACDSFAIVAALTMALASDHPWNRGEIYVVSLSAMLLLTLVYVFFLLAKPRSANFNKDGIAPSGSGVLETTATGFQHN